MHDRVNFLLVEPLSVVKGECILTCFLNIKKGCVENVIVVASHTQSERACSCVQVFMLLYSVIVIRIVITAASLELQLNSRAL